MKRFVMLLVVMLAIPAAASAAMTSGGGTSISGGQATLVSNGSHPYSFLSFDDLNGGALGSISTLSAGVVSADYAGGAPRFSIELSNGKSVFVYLGDAPNFTSGGSGDTGNLIASSDLRFDTSQIGGTFYDTWAHAETLAAGTTITGIDFVVDGDWATSTGTQTVVLSSVTINNTTYHFAAQSKEDCKNGGWAVFGYKNQGDCVSAFASGK
jgi:hypothetical protein